MIKISGKDVAEARRSRLKAEIHDFTSQTGRAPGLAVVLVGEDPASQVYVRNKTRTCGEVGIRSFEHALPATTSQENLIGLIKDLNANPAVDGILVQLPLPKALKADLVLETIEARKDPDGLTYENMGLLWAGRKRVAPCTPYGVMALLEHYSLPVAGRRAVVIGRSNIVGKPMAQLLLDANATVTICHSRTTDLFAHTKEADIVVVAAGQERFIGREAFKKGAVVIDVGMHRPTSGPYAGKLCGDVRYEELEGWASAATPVPGGVGPMTIQMLMENTFALAKMAEQSRPY